MRHSRVSRAAARSAGFTLIEVLAAMTLSALVMLALVQAYQAGADAWRRGQQEADFLQAGRFFLSRLSGEVENACFSRFNTRITFVGEPGSLRFVTHGPDGLSAVWYRFDVNRSVIFRDTATTIDPDAWWAPRQVWLEAVHSVSFRYYDELRKTWYDRWDSRYPGRLPELVEVRLSLKGDSAQSFPPVALRLHAGRRISGPRMGGD